MNRRGMPMRQGGGIGGVLGTRGSMGGGPMLDNYMQGNFLGGGFQRESSGGMPKGGRMGGRFQGGPVLVNSMGSSYMNYMGERFQRGNGGSGGSMGRRQG
uniref:Uncharacterized protein n=1 Tax=Cuerna arida TaxID=1464854 RepID=A0A1B6GZ21_9HEMI